MQTLNEVQETRFGSSAEDLVAAAGILRAMAGRFGISLKDTSRTDLAASVISADIWTHVTQKTPGKGGGNSLCERSVLRSILLRASGQGSAQTSLFVEGDLITPADIDALVADVEGYGRWCRRMVGSDAAEALRRAANDLEDGAGIFLAVADVLYNEADALENE